MGQIKLTMEQKFYFIQRTIESCYLPSQLEACKKMILNYNEPKGQELLFYKLEEKIKQFES